MAGFYYRTEDINKNEVLKLFVENSLDREIVDLFKNTVPTVLEGSRGTGKSFLMKVAEVELNNQFNDLRILPVYVAFMGSSLVHTSDPLQFRHWMLAKTIKEVLKQLRKKGLIISPYASSLLLQKSNGNTADLETKLEKIIKEYEKSFKNPNIVINSSIVPDINDVTDSFNDMCETLNINRICIFFDEAAHVFRPEQQRQFFTMFRDLRSPYISCNAAVYPGVTHYGNSFELTHDANFRRIERDLLERNYLNTMRKMVLKQLGKDNSVKNALLKHKDYFNTLAYSASGNPRILFKTISRCPKINATGIESVIKQYYRADIWSEHTALGEKYNGHKSLIDWGRIFIEDHVIPATLSKNKSRRLEGKNESTIYFWIHKDAPEKVKEALRLLSYTGIIRKMDDGVRATRSEIGSRYEIKYGCILSMDATPLRYSKELRQNLVIKRFSEFGANHPAYEKLVLQDMQEEQDSKIADMICTQLTRSIDVLDLTEWQKCKLNDVGVTSIESLLSLNEEYLIENIYQVGPVRARTMKNAATAELLEYLSG